MEIVERPTATLYKKIDLFSAVYFYQPTEDIGYGLCMAVTAYYDVICIRV